ncbi:MAG: universal stress protein [Phycisphaerae bacterium]
MGDILESANQQMQAFFDEHLVGLEYPAITHVSTGRPFVEIIRYAKEITADIIIIPTHGRGGVMHALLGSSRKNRPQSPSPRPDRPKRRTRIRLALVTTALQSCRDVRPMHPLDASHLRRMI